MPDDLNAPLLVVVSAIVFLAIVGATATTALDNIAILTTAIDESGVVELPEPVAWWKLDETTIQTGSNLIINSGFENYATSPGIPNNWLNNGGNANQYTKETTIIKTGTNALKISADGSSTGAGVRQTINGLNGSYLVTAQARTGGTGTAELRLVDLTTLENIAAGRANSSTQFQEIRFAFTAISSHSYEIQARYSSAVAGQILYYDDITIQPTTPISDSSATSDLAFSGTTDQVAQPGKIGTSFDFANQYGVMGIVNPLGTTPTPPYTICLWLEYNGSAGGDFDFVFSLSEGASGASRIALVASNFTGTPVIEFSTRNVGGGASSTITATQDLSNNGWHMICGSIDATNVMRLYLDSTLVATGTNTKTPANIDTIALGFNADNGGSMGFAWETFVDGKIDDIRIYNESLNQPQVSFLYDQTSPTFSSLRAIITPLGLIVGISALVGLVALIGTQWRRTI